jgi:hypothetical protein
MTDPTAIAVGAAVGSGITGAFGIVSLWLQRRSDERRQIRELAVQVAIKNWQISYDYAKQKGGSLLPLDVFLVNAVNLVESLDGRRMTVEDIEKVMRRGNDLSEVASKCAEKP